MKTNLSIIIVCFNSEKTISRCLESIKSQSVQPAQVIVKDGGSTDGTLNLIQEFDLDVVISEPDNGIYEAMNIGIDAVTCPYFMFLNSDDYFASNEVISSLDNFRYYNYDLTYCDISYTKNNIVKRSWISGPPSGVSSLPVLASRIPHPCFLIRTELIMKFGAFDVRYRLAADYDAILKYLSNTKRHGYLPINAVNMELGGATNASIGNIVKQNFELFIILRRQGYSFLSWMSFFVLRFAFKIRQS